MDILKNLWYMARRFKTATVLNLLGLTVAFTAFYLLITQVDYSRSFNQSLKDADRIYRLETFIAISSEDPTWQTNNSRPVAEMVEQMPQVEAMGLINSGWNVALQVGDERWPMGYGVISHRMMDVFQPQLISGKLTATDEDQKGVLIPASLAMKLYGRLDVAGELIKFDSMEGHVRGVYQDFPKNCNIRNDIYVDMGDENKDAFNNYNYTCYVKLRENTDPTKVLNGLAAQVKQLMHKTMLGQVTEEDIQRMGGMDTVEKMFEDVYGKYDYRLQPVSETYFSGVDPTLDKGNPNMLFILELASLLVILVAIINFLNFALAESPVRVRGINTRRVLGEGLTSLRLKLMGETIILSLLACGLAIAAVWLLSMWPAFGEMLQGSILLGDHIGLILLLVGLSILVGILAGFYPARFMTSFAPALALKGSFGLTPRGRQLRTSLICLQLFISSMMVIYIGILYLQSHYIHTSDYGFAKDEIAYVATNKTLREKHDALRSELLQLTGVKDASYSNSVIATQDSYMGWGRRDNDHEIHFACFFVDHNYLRTMGIPIVEGRDFNEHDQGCYIINEAARKQWTWVKMGQKVLNNEYPVVGVCKNMRFLSTRQSSDEEALAFFIPDEEYAQWGQQYNMLNIRIAANTDKREMRRKIQEVVNRFDPDGQVDVKYIDQSLEELYQEENRFIRQVIGFSLVCLFITLIGVFCLTMFETEYRRKEIGIRKVYGASVKEILRLISRRYVVLTVVAFVIAAPLAWYFGHTWLENFAERTPIYWWLFPLALLLIALVTLLTVLIQSWRAATENPINSIKTE